MSVRRRQYYSQRQQSTLSMDTVEAPAQGSMMLENSAANSYPYSNGPRRNASSSVQVANHKEGSAPVDGNGIIEQRADVGVRETPTRGVRPAESKLQRAKNRIFRSIRAMIPGYKDSKVDKTIVPQVPNSRPIDSKLSPSRGEKALPAAPHHPGGDQGKTANARDAEQTASDAEEIEKLRRDLSESHYQIAELQRRCQVQSRDLENSNNFLNIVDKSSESDITHALNRLNAEVQKSTTYMADSLVQEVEFRDVGTDPTEEQSIAAQRASDHVGQVLMKSFAAKTSEEIRILLQITFQAYLVSVLWHMASSWAFEPSHSAFIDGVYQRLRKVEAQAISGRWRALTRVHIVQGWVNDPAPHVREMIAGLSDIVLAAGCTATQNDILSRVGSKFEEKITSLIELAGRLNKLFDEVISSDFEVFVVPPGEKFDKKKMDVTGGGQVGNQEEAMVLCTTHMGMTKRIPVGTVWEKGRKQKTMVVKAKVLPESFLNAGG